MKQQEGIVQIISRRNTPQQYNEAPTHPEVKDEIWGLSNYGKLYQFDTKIGEWSLRGSELE